MLQFGTKKVALHSINEPYKIGDRTKWDKVKELIDGTQKRERIEKKGIIWMLRQATLTKYGQINVY